MFYVNDVQDKDCHRPLHRSPTDSRSTLLVVRCRVLFQFKEHLSSSGDYDDKDKTVVKNPVLKRWHLYVEAVPRS